MILVKTAVMLVNKICTITSLQLIPLNLVDWIGKTNPGRTRLRAFLGVLDWLVPPLVPCVPKECLNEAPMQLLVK